MEDKTSSFRDELNNLYAKYVSVVNPQLLEYKEFYIKVYNLIDKSSIVTEHDHTIMLGCYNRDNLITGILKRLLRSDSMKFIIQEVNLFKERTNKYIKELKLDFTYSHDKLIKYLKLTGFSIMYDVLINIRIVQLMEDPYYTNLFNTMIDLHTDLCNTLQNITIHKKPGLVVYFHTSQNWDCASVYDNFYVSPELQLLVNYINEI